jgi:hypothetical protein
MKKRDELIMKRSLTFVLVVVFSLVFASLTRAEEPPPSLIVEVQGDACVDLEMASQGNETHAKSWIRERALRQARERAFKAATDYLLQRFPSDMAKERLVPAYKAGQVKILFRNEGQWSTQEDASGQTGLCYTEKVQAEVLPSDATLRALPKKSSTGKDSDTPLTVSLWTDKSEYAKGESMRLFIEGNKGFYGLIVYKDVSGDLLQLLPNAHREDNYFEGGVVYEFPTGGDRFKLEAAPPFGLETLTLYAATAPLGDLETSPAGSFYRVKTSSLEMEVQVRSMASPGRHSDDGTFVPVEFASDPVTIRTHE